MKPIKHIAILDDEKPAVDGLVAQLKKLLPGADIAGFMRPEVFVEHCRAVGPELVFLDMEMPNAMGLDVAKEVRSFVGNIVFATAYTEYSLQAFETAIGYLLKPITPSKLKGVLEKAAALVPLDDGVKKYVRLPSKGHFIEREERDIMLLKGQRNYTLVVLSSGEEILVAKTLKAFSEELSTAFLRIHKGAIVREGAICRVHWGVKPTVELENGLQVEASRTRLKELGLHA